MVASVFAFTVLSTGIFASERSKDTVFAGLDEVRSSLEQRGSVVAYEVRIGATPAFDTISKVVFIVSSAVQGEGINLTPPYTANDAADDPDVSAGALYGTVISYTSTDQYVNDVPWTVAFPGYHNSDNILDPGEKAEITVWLFNRDNTVTNATDNNGIKISSTGGSYQRYDYPGRERQVHDRSEARVWCNAQHRANTPGRT